jgi:uncharacterized protein (TIGR02145 family)
MGIYSNYPDSIYDNGGGGGGDVGAPYLKNIMPTTGVKVVDENGYIGGNFLGVYYPNTNYYNNFAIVVPGADYSNEGLGNVTFVDTTATIGGRVYRTVTIGGVTWLAENLDFKFSGCGIGGSGTPSTPSAWYYGNDEATYGWEGKKYGLLYNWHAVKLLNDNRATLIPGWHVPSTTEWDTLANTVGGASTAGTVLKSTTDWTSGAGTDVYGFTVLPTGYRFDDSFDLLGSNAYFWTADEYVSTYAYNRSFNTGTSMDSYYSRIINAHSVRLVADS